MAIVAFAGGETGVLGDEVNNSGTTSVVTSPVKSGTYAYRSNPTTTAAGNLGLQGYQADGTMNNAAYSAATAYHNAWFYVATLPAANDEPIFRARSGTTQKLELRINSSGNLVAYDRTGTLIATGSTALSLNTWYNIGIKVGTGASASYEVQIDGVSELSSATVDLATGNNNNVQWGKANNRNGQTVDFYFDALVTDDAQFNNGLVAKLSQPTANGAVMQWTAGTGASDYTQVIPIPRTNATYVTSTGSAGDVARFTTQSLSTLGISGQTIKAVAFIAFMRENSATTSDSKLRVVSGATTTDTTGNDGGTGVTTYGNILNTDPNTGSAWTETNFNAVEYGAIESNAVATRCIWTGAYILYVPSSGVPFRPWMQEE